MRIGTCHLWGESLAGFREEVRLAEQLGFEVITVGDSPAGWHELYVSLAVAAQETKRAILGPLVTSPFVRHPLVTANAMASLHDLTGGRVALGLATGGSTVLGIGRMPATQSEIHEYFVATRDLFAGKPATYEGRPVAPLRYAHKVPIYYSAFGPKALQLAGELADGVILFTNSALDHLDAKLDAVRSAAKRAGRNPEAIDVWVISFCSIRETRQAAIDDLKAFIVVNGMAIRTPEALAQVPAQYRDKLHELHRRYDPTEHVVVGGKNVQLMDELGLTEYLSSIDTVAGTPQDVKATLDGLAARGVSCFIAALPGQADRLGTLRRLSQVAGRS
jgi:alkanesulfonate monooxygenase SsuD/methylene tetrahydromethanopterin reductase-like flavin-dependent oxidoreductase (luciferase family)